MARRDRRRDTVIHFESYIIHDDDVGDQFGDALIAKARDGVRVRVIYDWMGGFGKTSRRFWKRLRAGGVEVRCYNPPRLASPLGWLSRDHRKMLAVDGTVGFVTGLCVGQAWVGDPGAKHRAVARYGRRGARAGRAAHRAAFAADLGDDGRPDSRRRPGTAPSRVAPAGETSLRVVATVPKTAGLFRLDQLVAALARERLWLTDAYYAGTTPYVQALRAAARDGVDVRLLVPERNRHSAAPTAVAGGLSSAAGSGRARLRVERHDAAREDGGRRRTLGARRLDESQHRELVRQLRAGRGGRGRALRAPDGRRCTSRTWRTRRRSSWTSRSGSGVATTGPTPCAARGRQRRARGRGPLRIGNTVGAAFTDRRVLEPVEARIMTLVGLLALIVGILVALFPGLLAYPMATLSTWVGGALLYRGYRLWRRARGGRRIRDAHR